MVEPKMILKSHNMFVIWMFVIWILKNFIFFDFLVLIEFRSFDEHAFFGLFKMIQVKWISK